MRSRITVLGLVCIAALALGTPPALAGSHLWRIHEVFSSADGSVQFIEMKECCGANNETGLSGKWVRSLTTGNQFNFPGNLPCCTANRHLLLATEAFAALPGAPTPAVDLVLANMSNDESYGFWLKSQITTPSNQE